MPPDLAALARRREAAVQALRRLTPSAYIAKSGSEALAGAVVASPALLFFYFLDGMFVSHYPRVPAGQPVPPPPNSLGGLLKVGAKYSLACTTRTVLFVAATAGSGAALREVLRVGPRFEDSSLENPLFHGANFVAGAACATLGTSDWAAVMGKGRRLGYIGLGGFFGVMLPFWLVQFSPIIRQKMQRLFPMPAPAAVQDDAGSGVAPMAAPQAEASGSSTSSSGGKGMQ